MTTTTYDIARHMLDATVMAPGAASASLDRAYELFNEGYLFPSEYWLNRASTQHWRDDLNGPKQRLAATARLAVNAYQADLNGAETWRDQQLFPARIIFAQVAEEARIRAEDHEEWAAWLARFGSVPQLAD